MEEAFSGPGVCAMKTGPWIGFDLDGTLCQYGEWKGPHHIGEPIKPMVDLAKAFMRSGMRVKIFTARVGPSGTNYADGTPIDQEYAKKARVAIEAWCVEHLGEAIEITCEKDFQMVFYFDDRAISVEENTGIVLADFYRMPCVKGVLV